MINFVTLQSLIFVAPLFIPLVSKCNAKNYIKKVSRFKCKLFLTIQFKRDLILKNDDVNLTDGYYNKCSKSGQN